MSRATADTLPISYGSYNVESLLGNGSYGVVYKVFRRGAKSSKQAETDYNSLKVIETKDASEKLKKMVENERKLMQSLNHINVILYKESFYDNTKLCLVMEYCQGGTLYENIRVSGEGLPERTFLSYLRQIAEGVKYLHSKSIIHRDLKSKNLLLKDLSKTTIKIADFGVARVITEECPIQHRTRFVGTVHFMSPEMIDSKSYTNKTDIWSIGCTCVEMGTAEYAFSGGTIPRIRELVNNVKVLEFDKVAYCDDIKGLILSMLKKNPDERPTVDEILQILMQHNAFHLDSETSRGLRRQMSETSSQSNRWEMDSGTRTLPENVLADSLMNIQREREQMQSNIDLLERQSANLQGVIVREIGQRSATEIVTRIKRWYRLRRQDDAEIKTRDLLGQDMFTRLKFLFRALCSIEDGIREFKRTVGDELDDASVLTSTFGSEQTA